MRAAACLLAVASCGLAAASGPDLIFMGGREPLRLRLEVRIDGKSPDAVWEAFLDRLFNHLDRDGDGSLSATEAARGFPLPLLERRTAALDFGRLDADRDGKGSPAELKAFYREAGFNPVVASVAPPDASDLQLSEVLFQQLDRDGDGRLTGPELEKAADLLKRLDQDEDEVLTAAELLSPRPDARAPRRPAVEVDTPAATVAPDAVLHVPLGEAPSTPRITPGGGRPVKALPTGRADDPFRFRLGDGFCTVLTLPPEQGVSLRAARAFYLAQLRAVLGDRPTIEKKGLEQEPAAQGLASLFDHADRDGDGRLAAGELESFLKLIEQGVLCQAVVTVTDRGRNLLDALDTDRNGRLDLHELNRAQELLAWNGAAAAALTRDDVPRQYRLTVERGSSGPSFGPVPLAAPVKRPAPAQRPAARGPGWFRALDRNADGYVSPREFLGPPEVFRRLDADGDRVISAEEAERAGPLAPLPPER